MPPRRTRPPARPVRITLDGSSIVADADASIATALVGAGHLALARSPKFHRPRGPSCHRGGCDGCLMRIDGVPNVMSCVVDAHPGAKIERQNVVLSSKLDLLRATDWFFPNGMNHHEMFAGIPGVQSVMQAFARRVSGLGELPDAPLSPAAAPVDTVRVDVLIVGGGPAGMLAAAAIAATGAKTLLLDEQGALGGGLLYFPSGARVRLGAAEVEIDRARDGLIEGVERAGAARLLRATALGVLEGGDWIVDRAATDARGLVRIDARAHVVATGAHDGAALFVGNDLPGVISARAAGRLLRDGVLIGERPIVAGEGPFAEAFAIAAAAEGARVSRVDVASLIGVRGMSAVRAVVVADGDGERTLEGDALVIDVPRAPSFEIAVEAGADVDHVPGGYAVRIDEAGRAKHASSHPSARPLFAIGEVAGAPLDLDALACAAERVAVAIARALEGSKLEARSTRR